MSEETRTPLNHHPGAIDIDTYLRATRRPRGLFRTRAASVAAVVALALGSAAAGNLAPRWGGEHLVGANLKDAVMLAQDGSAPERRRDMALEFLQRTSVEALLELLSVAEKDSGPTGERAALQYTNVMLVSLKALRKLASQSGWGADRARQALGDLGLKD